MCTDSNLHAIIVLNIVLEAVEVEINLLMVAQCDFRNQLHGEERVRSKQDETFTISHIYETTHSHCSNDYDFDLQQAIS